MCDMKMNVFKQGQVRFKTKTIYANIENSNVVKIWSWNRLISIPESLTSSEQKGYSYQKIFPYHANVAEKADISSGPYLSHPFMW